MVKKRKRLEAKVALRFSVTCDGCGNEFASPVTHARWCSDECYRNGRVQPSKSKETQYSITCSKCGRSDTMLQRGTGKRRTVCRSCSAGRVSEVVEVRVDAKEPCRGRLTMVCPRVDCHRNCAYEEKSSGVVSLARLRCSLAVSAEGEHTVEEVASLLGVTSSRVQQIEARAIAKLRRLSALKEHVR